MSTPRRLIRVIGLGATTTAALLSGCTSPTTDANGQSCDKTYRIGFSHSLSDSIVVRMVREFASERAAEVGCIEMLYDNTQNNDLESQVTAIDGWVNQNVDAIVALPIDTAALEPLRRRAQEQGTKFLTYLGRMDDTDGFVGFDHAQSGELVAQAAIDWARAHPEITPKALITTNVGMPAVADRWKVPIQMFEDAGIEVVAIQDGATIEAGQQITEDTLRADPGLNIVIGWNDDVTIGAAKVFERAGKTPEEVFVAGQDGSVDALQAIKDNAWYNGSAAILLDELGSNVVDLAMNAVNGTGETERDAPTVLASRDDQEQLDELIAVFGK